MEKNTELVDTLKVCPNVKEVYFSANGEHYFHAYEKGDHKYGQFNSGIPVKETKIIKTMKRDELLGKTKIEDAVIVDEKNGKKK